MKKPIVFIHLGPHRTASTYIQNVLSANRNNLFENGLLYPKSVMDDDGTHNSIFLSDSDTISHYKAMLYDEIEETGAKFLLLSAEEAFIRGPNYINNLFPDQQIYPIIFFREIVTWSYSLWAINVQSDNLLSSYVSWLSEPNYLTDFIEKIHEWTGYFGKNMVILPYFENTNGLQLHNPVSRLLTEIKNRGPYLLSTEVISRNAKINQSLLPGQLLFYQRCLQKITEYQFLEHFDLIMRHKLIQVVRGYKFCELTTINQKDLFNAKNNISSLWSNFYSDIYSSLLINSPCYDELTNYCVRMNLDKSADILVDNIAHLICNLIPTPYDFEEVVYGDLNQDVVRDGQLSPANHWRRYGAAEGRMYKNK